MNSGRHDVVQFVIAADKDGGGCTRIAPSLQHGALEQYPQTQAPKEVHDPETYQFLRDLAVMIEYAAIQFDSACWEDVYATENKR